MYIDTFNELAGKILTHLYEHFPVACVLKVEEFVQSISITPYPPSPVDTRVRGPFSEWDFTFGKAAIEKRKAEFDWQPLIAEVEAHLGRKMSAAEIESMRDDMQRPTTPEEDALLAAWEEDKREIDVLRKSEEALREDAATKRRVFEGTLQFLVNERLIRFTDPKPDPEGRALNPADILIHNSVIGPRALLSYVLTAHGLSQLNKIVDGGNVMHDTVYQRLRKLLLPKATEGAISSASGLAVTSLGTAVGPLVSILLS